MLRLITAMLITAAIVVFAVSNAHDVELSCVIGEPVRIRLFVLLAITFLAGALTASFSQMLGQAGRRARRRRRRRPQRVPPLLPEEEDE